MSLQKNLFYNRESNLGRVKFDIPKSLDEFINENTILSIHYTKGKYPENSRTKTPENPYHLPATWIE